MATIMAATQHTPQQLPIHSNVETSIEQPIATNSNHPMPTTDSDISTSTSEIRPVNPRSPIPEEEEDETSSETLNEPLTPTDTHSGDAFHNASHDDLKHGPPTSAPVAKAPLILSTPATPHLPKNGSKSLATPAADKVEAQTSSQTKSVTKEPVVKRGLSQLFRRSNSHTKDTVKEGLPPTSAPDSSPFNSGIGLDMSSRNRRLSSRRLSNTTTPNTTRSNTPPSPGSPNEAPVQHKVVYEEPDAAQWVSGVTKNRSSTGLNLRDKFVTFGGAQRKPKHLEAVRPRVTSIDLETAQTSNSRQLELIKASWGFPAEAGTGLKSRRMSLSLPDDFTVDVVDLHKEFADQSKILGRRGKTLGKGATSTVKLMIRKGGSSSELFAVKEFRVRDKVEKEKDYEKKVKSEYTIAKSLHHPNIVETFRLCTDHGRWNHVMEYCEEGDLFKFVENGFLKQEERLVDRICLFKQMIQGINYLHEHGIAHRDIKLENLLITNQSKLKITDFGVSEVFCGIHPGLRSAGGQCGKEMGEIRLCAPGICGSMPYIAPEVVTKQGEYDPRPLDVWSSAIVMLYLTFGGALWQRAETGNQNYDSLIKGWQKWNLKHPEGGSITENDYPHVYAFDQMVNPPALRRLLVGMLNPEPGKRLTISEVMNNRWMKNVECCQVDSYDDPSLIIDASKVRKNGHKASLQKVVAHNHLPPVIHRGHQLVRLPGSTDM